MQPPTMLVVLDGFGNSKKTHGNAVLKAYMPFWHYAITHYPSTLLHASGPSVGLPDGYIGNSEVGHLTIGAGRVVESTLKKFHDAISDGSFFKNKLLIEKFATLKASGTSLHLLGLLSDAGVHSHDSHLFALLKLAKDCGLTKVFIHAFLDGRDVAPKSAEIYLERLISEIKNIGCGSIASISGRLYAMDRDANWDRTQQTYVMLCNYTRQALSGTSWQAVLNNAYNNKLTDEFVIPQLLDADGAIKPGDGVVFFNFRPDRARQLTEAFINPRFHHFSNQLNTGMGNLAFFITTTRHKEQFAQLKNDVLFEREKITNTLLDEIASHNHPPVFIIAETEKYAHVTYFFRGMEDKHLPHETRMIVPSIKLHSYANDPEMSAPNITQALMHSLHNNPAYFYLVNYANPDMVGHSGNFDATIKACTFIDQQIEMLYKEVVLHHKGTLIITADHGNAEEKIDANGNPLTAHTTNPVPFVLINPNNKFTTQAKSALNQTPTHGLANVAPTILKFMGLDIPTIMEQTTIF